MRLSGSWNNQKGSRAQPLQVAGDPVFVVAGQDVVDGISTEEVAVAGDAINDVPMLTWAGTALCPSNALPEVLALADHVLPSNDEDGVASYLEGLRP